MSLDLVDTNIGAMDALSAGFRVADASKDGAAYAIARNIRSDAGALTSANQQSSTVQGLPTTTLSGLKIDALNSGLGSLVDADLAKESAQLTALQIRQQLGTQALSVTNQAPRSLLSLFK